MVEIEKTTDPIRLSFVRAALAEAGVDAVVFDSAAGALWPGAIPMRVMVDRKDAFRARAALKAAESDLPA